VVGKFYTVDVLTVYHTHLTKIINVAFNLSNYCKKSTGPFFKDTVYKWPVMAVKLTSCRH